MAKIEKLPSTAVNKIIYLLKNPANGGIPAIENNVIMNVNDNIGEDLEIVHKLEI
jgi:hypothetical protein